jgi:DNA primase
MDSKPLIEDIVGRYVELRRVGRELWGLCPFHSEKTPSFSVNPEKQVFYCHGCHAGGDVVTFVEKFEQIDFKTAAKKLGLEKYQPDPERLARRNQAKDIAHWARETSKQICDVLREIGDQIHVCSMVRKELGTELDKATIVAHGAGLVRQWAILCDLHDDLNNPAEVVDLWLQRDDINGLVESLT